LIPSHGTVGMEGPGRQGKTLLVNPGEIWGHFTGLSSIAILDTASLQVETIELGRFKTFREIINE